MKNIGVIFGGQSSEYEVSLDSASSFMEAMDLDKYNLIKIGIAKDGRWFLFEGEIEDVRNDSWLEYSREIYPLFGHEEKGFMGQNDFIGLDLLVPIMHGELVEDGSIQGVFRMMGIPYIGCDVLASSIGFDKIISQILAESIGIKTTPSLEFIDRVEEEKLEEFLKDKDYPYFVKPLRAGSSKGVTKVKSYEDFQEAFKEAFKFDNIILIEAGVNGFEVGCGALDYRGQTLIGEVDEIQLDHGFFDYREKYNLISSKIHLPARIKPSTKKKIQGYTEEIYKLFRCKGLCRVDFFLDREEIYFNEVNTMPGFTSHSRFPSMFRQIGIDYPKLVELIISNGLGDFND